MSSANANYHTSNDGAPITSRIPSDSVNTAIPIQSRPVISYQKPKSSVWGTIFSRPRRDILRMLALGALAYYAVLVSSVALFVLVNMLAILQIPLTRAWLVNFIKYMTTFRFVVNTIDFVFRNKLSSDKNLSQSPWWLQIVMNLSLGWLFGLLVCAIDWVFHKLLETPCLYDEIWDTHKLSLTVESPLEAERRLRRENLSDREILTALTKQYQRVFDRLPSSDGVNPVSSNSDRDSENGHRTGSQSRSGEVGGVAPPVDVSVGQTEGVAVGASSGTAVHQESALQTGSVAGVAHSQSFSAAVSGGISIHTDGASTSGPEQPGAGYATINDSLNESNREGLSLAQQDSLARRFCERLDEVLHQDGSSDSKNDRGATGERLLDTNSQDGSSVFGNDGDASSDLLADAKNQDGSSDSENDGDAGSSQSKSRSRTDSTDSLGEPKTLFRSPGLRQLANSAAQSAAQFGAMLIGSPYDVEFESESESETSSTRSGDFFQNVPSQNNTPVRSSDESSDTHSAVDQGQDGRMTIQATSQHCKEIPFP
jgi:hypothetical protein